jgi:dihydrofolate synthase/folylpolyglutamate synthase
LRGIHSLLNSLDHPEKRFASIHIAGTNGKGSTASMIAAIFTAAGYKTGLYTSPHLVKFNERIRINGKPISSKTVARLTSVFYPEVAKNKNTFFEAVTAMAFKHFAESEVDVAIIETGLGGRLDATNVLQPLVSVITTIGLEHTYILGNKIEEIAFEKGGIIKKGLPCVTGVASLKALRVLKKTCVQNKSQLIQVNPKQIHIRNSSLRGLSVDFVVAGKQLKRVKVSLAGVHQAMNALMAINTIEIAAQRTDFEINEKAIRDGLRNIQKYSGIQARLSIVRRNPLVLADVAHNPEAVRKLCDSIEQLNIGKIHILFGLMLDKNFTAIISALRKIARSAYIVEAHTQRSRSAAELAKEFRRFGVVVKEFGDVASGIKSALQQGDGVPILITGSHFVVGEALASFRREKYLTINQ